MASQIDNLESNPLEIMGFPIYYAGLIALRLSGETFVVNTLNAYSYILTKRDPEFSEALKHSDALIPDGFPIVAAARFLKGEKITKVAGADVFYHYCGLLNQVGGRCFFLGSSDKTLALIRKRMGKEFPNICVGTFSPPFKAEFSEEDNQKMLTEIRSFQPDVLFVGMTAPKQEKWVYACKNGIKAGVVCSIGAVFDFYAGTVTRPSRFWINLHLEWFIRLLKEPRRLWKRYLVYSPLFFLDMLKFKFRG